MYIATCGLQISDLYPVQHSTAHSSAV